MIEDWGRDFLFLGDEVHVCAPVNKIPPKILYETQMELSRSSEKKETEAEVEFLAKREGTTENNGW